MPVEEGQGENCPVSKNICCSPTIAPGNQADLRPQCDELRPVCLRCHRNGRVCEYKGQGAANDGPRQPVRHGAPSRLSSVTVMPFSSQDAPNGTPSLYLMQHLWANWVAILNIDRRPEVTNLLKSDPLVRNVVLTLTASHLRHQVPGYRQHRIAELFQKSLALEDYKKRLELPRAVLGQDGVNSLLISATILNLLTFALPEPDVFASNEDPYPESSWLFSPRKDRLSWLALQAGLRPLMLSLAEYLTDGLKFMTLVFTGESTDLWRFTRLVQSLDGVPEHWIDFFELEVLSSGCECTGMSDAYRAPATILATTRHVEINRFNIFRSLQFLGKLQGDFRTLIYRRDERALWLLGYWLGDVSRYGLWWCERRARRDYRAICLWLHKLRLPRRPGREGELWGIMMEELASVDVLPSQGA